ncbi:MAG: hypothetical protein LBV43_04985 [Prevotella sp.]|jgi:hypothetical protein|nr:hypothetical protein [Prevotella sp.]
MKIRRFFIYLISTIILVGCSAEEDQILGDDSQNDKALKSSMYLPVPTIGNVSEGNRAFQVFISNAAEFVQIQYYPLDINWISWQFYTNTSWGDYKFPVSSSGVMLDLNQLPRGDAQIRARSVASDYYGNSYYSEWSYPERLPHNWKGFFPELPGVEIPDDGHAYTLLTIEVKLPALLNCITVSAEAHGDARGSASVSACPGDPSVELKMLVDTEYNFDLEVSVGAEVKFIRNCYLEKPRESMSVDFSR